MLQYIVYKHIDLMLEAARGRRLRAYSGVIQILIKEV